MPIEITKILLWLKKILIIGTTLTFLIVLLWVISNYGFITINTISNDNTQVELIGANKKYLFNDYSSGTKKLVKKGDYNLMVTKGNDDSFTAIKQKGFLTNNEVEASLSNKGRQEVVATNQNDCSIISKNVISSFPCGYVDDVAPGEFTVTKHVPSTSSQPSYLEETENVLFFDERNLGIVELNNDQSLMLVNVHSDSEDIKYIYQLRLYNNDNFSQPINSRLLNLGEGDWSIKKYLNGVIIYSKSAVTAYYIDSYKGQMKKINFEKLGKIEGYEYEVEVYDKFATYYYSAIEDSNTPTKEKFMDISTISNGTDPEIVKLEGYNYAFLCGDDYVCIGQESDMIIARVDNLKDFFTIFNVSYFKNINDKIILTTPSGVVEYNIANNQGYVVYKSQNVEYCEINNIQNSLYVCAISKTINNKYLIKVDTRVPKNDDILTKISFVGEDSAIDSINVDRNNIFISLSTTATQNEATGRFEEDSDEFNVYKKRVDELIDEAGIDRNAYNIVIL